MKRAFQYVTHYGSANQEFADASVRRYEQKGVLRAGVPSPSPQSPSSFSLPPYPLPPTPFDSCYAGYFVTSIPVQYSNKFMHGFVKFLIGHAMERESTKILPFVKLLLHLKLSGK